MHTTEATYATRLHEPCIHVKAPVRGQALPFDCRAVYYCGCVVAAS